MITLLILYNILKSAIDKNLTFTRSDGSAAYPYFQAKDFGVSTSYFSFRSGKWMLHALICRAWKSRVKGRDLYDYLFYIEKEIPLDLSYLKNKLVQSGRIEEGDPFGKEEALSLFKERFSAIDFAEASKDVAPFLLDKEDVAHWDSKLFLDSLSLLKFRD